MKHTPGPWTAEHDADGDYAVFSGLDRLIAVTDSDSPQDAANARLIAAAPKMLEALKSAYGAINEELVDAGPMKQGSILRSSFMREVLAEVVKAISEAEGGE